MEAVVQTLVIVFSVVPLLLKIERRLSRIETCLRLHEIKCNGGGG